MALVALGLVAGGVSLAFLSKGYIDFGDGNYLYIGWRITQGAVLYRDILSPQPPLHVLLGSLLIRVGALLGSAIYTVRVVQILVHLLTGWLIYRLARRWQFGRGTGVLAAAIWWVCPIGFRWSMGWQSENIEIPLLLTAQILLARRGRLTLLLSGLCGAGALLCNMTAAPYVLFNGLFALVAFRAAGLLYWLGLLGGWGGVAGLFEWGTGAFFQNVIFNQLGSYPREDMWTYFANKLISQGSNVIRVEGLWVGLAVAGLIIAGIQSRRRWRDPVALYRGLYSIGGLLSILYVTKGGTVDYIFCLGEPYVALWAAFCLVELANRPASVRSSPPSPVGKGAGGLGPLLPALIFALGCYQAEPYLWRYLSQRGFEWPEDKMAYVVAEIDRHTRPGDLILAPPYFAFITRHPIVEDFSETYLWYIKWLNETLAGTPGEATAKMDRIAEDIREGRVALIVLNGLSPELVAPLSRGMTLSPDTQGRLDRYIATITPIRRALFESCRLVGPRLQSNILHVWAPGAVTGQEDLTFWVPRERPEARHE